MNILKKSIRGVTSLTGIILIIIATGIIGVIVTNNYTSSPSTLTIQLSEQSLRVPNVNTGIITYSSLRSFTNNNEYVIVMQTIGYTPKGYIINSSAILSKGFKQYMTNINLKEFIKIWEKYYRVHTPYSFARYKKDMPLPTITTLLITYLPNGKILVGANEIDSYKLLLMMGYRPGKARKILMQDPLYPFRQHIRWKLNVTLQPVNIDEIVKNITRSVEKITGQSFIAEGAPIPAKYQGVSTQVWLTSLYNSRNNPPQSWYSHIVDINNNPAPQNIVKNTWYAFATRFSQEYYFDKSSWKLSDAIRFALLGQSYKNYNGKPTTIMTMTNFIHILYDGTAGYHWKANLIDETVEVPILYITTSYNVPSSQELYITFSGGVIKANSTGRLMGLSIFGYIIGTMKYSLSVKNCGIDIDYGKPNRAVMAPLHLSNSGAGAPDNLVVLVADVKDNGNQWVIKPLVMFLPYLTTININYNDMKVVTLNNGAPENYNKIVWESYLHTVYDDLVTKTSSDPFYTLTFASGNAALTSYSGSIIGYYFPLIGNVLEQLGFVGQAASTLGDLIGIAEATASSNPLVSVGLFIAELIGKTINIALYQASGSLVVITVYGNQHILENNVQIPVEIKVRYGYAANSPIYKPLFVELDITVGYVNAPPNAEILNATMTS
ncbi:MAG: hypothetical protein GXO43_04515 [Crenarchaeota archaeon]|nr:hypothetical protein [Thermoproteota archaeon]